MHAATMAARRLTVRTRHVGVGRSGSQALVGTETLPALIAST
jgi:hypothetical protein